MSGSQRHSDRGQLALMDAVVFFVIAIAVSSMIIRYSGEASSPAMAAREGQTDPEAVLEVLLRASIGNVTALELNGQTYIQASSDIATCLIVEIDALTDGAPLSAFKSLNERIVTILGSTCGAVYSPFLTAGKLQEDGIHAILAIPGEPPVSELQYASSMRLAGMNGDEILLTVVLSPSLSSEVAYVRAGELHFGPGIGHSSS